MHSLQNLGGNVYMPGRGAALEPSRAVGHSANTPVFAGHSWRAYPALGLGAPVGMQSLPAFFHRPDKPSAATVNSSEVWPVFLSWQHNLRPSVPAFHSTNTWEFTSHSEMLLLPLSGINHFNWKFSMSAVSAILMVFVLFFPPPMKLLNPSKKTTTTTRVRD